VPIASLTGLIPTPGMAVYTATKQGVVGFATALRPEAARHGVRVNVVCPALVTTDLRRNTRSELGARIARRLWSDQR
jgi:short-subunit dehydrogenase